MEKQNSLKFVLLYLVVSTLIALAYGFSQDPVHFDSQVFTLFFTGAIFSHALHLSNNRKMLKKNNKIQ
jgi:hypothetical protein